MKKKLFVVFMTIAMAVSLVCGMSFMTASASNEVAAQDTPAVNDEISRVDYTDTWGGGLLVGTFSVDGGYAVNPATNPVDMTPMKQYVEVTKANGTKLSDVSVEAHGTSVFLVRGQGYTPEKGDEVKFLTGFTYGACHLGEDVRFIYSGSGFVKQLPESAYTEIEVTNIAYGTDWGGSNIKYGLSLADVNAYGLYSSGDKGHLSYVNAFGEVKPLFDSTYLGSGVYITRLGTTADPSTGNITDPYYPTKGDIFTVQKGFSLTQASKGERTAKDFPFIYDGQNFIAYDAATHAVTELSITNAASENTVYIDGVLKLNLKTNDGAIYTPKFSTSDAQVATVSDDGTITGVAAGNATITAKVGDKEATYDVVVKAAPVVTGVEFETVYDILVSPDADEVTIPEDFAIVKIYSDNAKSSPILLTSENAWFKESVNVSALGDTATTATIVVEVEGKQYELTVNVKLIPEITVDSVNYVPTGWGAPTIVVKFNLANNSAYGTYFPGDKANLSYVNAYGEVKPLADCTYVNDGHFIMRMAESVQDGNKGVYSPMTGDIFTIKRGFTLRNGRVAEMVRTELKYIFDGSEAKLIPYVPATHAVTEFNITNDAAKNEVYAGATLQLTYSANEGALYTPKFTSSDDTVATVSASGVITGVQAGNVTITAKVGSFEKTFAVVVHPALTVEEVRFDRSYTIMAEKGSAAAIPSNFTVVKVFSNGSESEPIALTADNARFKTAVDTSVIPEDPMGLGRMKVTIVVTIDGEEYELEEYVRVYEVADLEITEVAPVEWFLYYSFIEYPNSTFNVCNITSVADLPNFADHIEYYRDGEKITVGLYILGKGNICVMPARADGKTVEGNSDLDNDNFNERLYKQGDTIKLLSGLTVYGHTGLAPTATDTGACSDDKGMLYKDAVLKNDVMYRFTGKSWSLYIPYTDMEVASETLEVALGTDNATVGATRVPANATTGKFTYVSSDTTVLTVAENGKINALKEGAATITVTLSSEDGETITKTVSVNVVNKIIRLEISGKLTVKPGTETLDLSKVKGYYVYGNGDRVEATDLANAIYVGYDPDEKGEQNVVIRVTHEGKQYTADLVVEVKAATQKKGCKSGVASASALSLLGLGVIALAKKKRK